MTASLPPAVAPVAAPIVVNAAAVALADTASLEMAGATTSLVALLDAIEAILPVAATAQAKLAQLDTSLLGLQRRTTDEGFRNHVQTHVSVHRGLVASIADFKRQAGLLYDAARTLETLHGQFAVARPPGG